jgi:hypothetical protein
MGFNRRKMEGRRRSVTPQKRTSSQRRGAHGCARKIMDARPMAVWVKAIHRALAWFGEEERHMTKTREPHQTVAGYFALFEQ